MMTAAFGTRRACRAWARATLPFSGWSTRFFDYDNDGWKDLFVAQGHVMDTIEKTSPNLRYLQPPLLLRNVSGRFVRVMPGAPFQREWAGRGAAFGDLDNDGDTDVVSARQARTRIVLRNDGGNRRNWLGIRTVGRKSNRDGIGCRVKVVSASGLTQYFTVNTAVGYLSASDKRLLVGLDKEPLAKLVEIRWPSGHRAEIRERDSRTDTGRDRAGFRGRHGRASKPIDWESRSMMTRRQLLALLACSAGRPAFAQGVSSRGVKPQPRGKPSGRPFPARFTDVAAQAGPDPADRVRRHRLEGATSSKWSAAASRSSTTTTTAGWICSC